MQKGHKSFLKYTLFSISLIAVSNTALISPNTPEIVADLGRDKSQIGLIFAFSTSPGILIAPILGLLADRFGKRRILIISLLFFGLGGIVGTIAGSFKVFLFSRFLVGIGNSGLIALVVTLFADSWEKTERIKLLGYNSGVIALGLLGFPIFGGWLSDNTNWRYSVLPMSLSIICAVIVFLIVPKSEKILSENYSLKNQLVEIKPVLLKKETIGALLMAFLIFFTIFGALLTVLPNYLKEEFNFTESQRSYVFAAIALTAGMAAFVVGRLRDRFGAKKLLIMVSAVAIIGYLLIGSSLGIISLIAGALIYGLAEGAAIPTLQEIIATNAPEAVRTTVMTVYISTIRIAQTAGALIYAYLSTQFDNGVLISSTAILFVLTGGVQLISNNKHKRMQKSKIF